MLSKRIIACLDVRDGKVVKGVNFSGLVDAGDPAQLARQYYTDGADEIVMLDVSATLDRRRAAARTIEAVASALFIPLVVGGGIRSLDDAAAVLDAGADKVAVNSAAVENPSLITALASRYGSQAVVVAIDVAKERGRFGVRTRSATHTTALDALEWARDAADRGAGEILVTSIDRDGAAGGFDCELTSAVSHAVPLPVIASGGAGTHAHFLQVFTEGCADAALAASVFHFSRTGVADVKRYLAERGVPMRLSC